MKYIRLVSDLHLNFDTGAFHQTRIHDKDASKIRDEMDMCWFPPAMDGDDDTCLVLAGDIWEDRKFLTRKYIPEPGMVTGKCWMEYLSEKFKYIVFLLGNHDYWGTNISYEDDEIRQAIITLGLKNVFFLERSLIVLDQVKFVGGILWTDYNNHHPMVLGDAKYTMAHDHRLIRFGNNYQSVKSTHLYEIHEKTKKFIFENVEKDNDDQKVVVVTHMAPSFKSIAPMYQADGASNYYYASNMDERILNEGSNITYWMHGHTHFHSDYMIGNVRVLSNARGYVNYESQKIIGFDPYFRLEI